MRLQTMLLTAIFAGALVAPLRAQATQDTTTKKPGGVNKVAHDVSATVKKAGRDTKAEVKRDASKSHEALTKAGNDTKSTLGDATGIHKVGGDVGKAANTVSSESKKVGRSAKGDLKAGSSEAHDQLTKAGKAIKDTTKKP